MVGDVEQARTDFRILQNGGPKTIHRHPLSVIGIVSCIQHSPVTATSLLDQLCFEGSKVLGIDDAKLGRIKFVFQESDNVLYFILEASAFVKGRVQVGVDPKNEHLDESPENADAEFLASCGWAELQQLANLLLIVNLCHALLWLCPGAAPRVDGETIRMISKLQELQAQNPLCTC